IPGQNDALRVIGFNGCNYLNGDWRLKGLSIKPAGEFITTLRACDDAPYEHDINIALDAVASYAPVDADNIVLKAADGRTVMKLRSRNLSFLNGAWKVARINGNAVPATADVRIVLDIEEGRIHGHAGCNIVNGQLLVNLDKGNALEFKNLVTTRMTCPDIATEQEFLLALEEASTATRGENASEALLKDSQGKTVITLTRLAPDSITEEEM
ncbi:MAG: META domain-containing protein, partial [Duncaniella sp.]|nr:META domain-containing protein [Duncaniella sp.]